jgi:predicted MFS family arabinose efflux permease
MLAVYAIVNGNGNGWTSAETLGLLCAALVLFGLFLAIEARVAAPLMPLNLFKHRNLSVANVTAMLAAASMFAMFFFSALYMQLVLGYSPLEVGLAYVPNSLLMAALSLGISAKVVMRFGIKSPIVAGMLLSAASLLLFARAPVDGSYAVDLLPPLMLLALGGGIAFNPMLLAAMGDVDQSEAGLASGVVNTSFMMGGALGLAILASVASSRTDNLVFSGETQLDALNSGYHMAFAVGAVFAIGAAALAGALLRPLPQHPQHAPGGAEPSGAPATVKAD